MKSLTHPLTPEFTFAGFTFPKHVWTLPKGKLAKRIEQAREWIDENDGAIVEDPGYFNS